MKNTAILKLVVFLSNKIKDELIRFLWYISVGQNHCEDRKTRNKLNSSPSDSGHNIPKLSFAEKKSISSSGLLIKRLMMMMMMIMIGILGKSADPTYNSGVTNVLPDFQTKFTIAPSIGDPPNYRVITNSISI